MPSITDQSVGWEAERAELESVLHSRLFTRSPALSHLLSYLCEKMFAGQTDQIKEYSVALDVFDRKENFDQDTDSIVRVQANRLRKRLSEYYASEGAAHAVHIIIPVGQYVPAFEAAVEGKSCAIGESTPRPATNPPLTGWRPTRKEILGLISTLALLILSVVTFSVRDKPRPPSIRGPSAPAEVSMEAPVGLPVGNEIRILAGTSRKYVDHAGKLWSPDAHFSGGTAVSSSVQHIWRTQDSMIYRGSRQGDFTYNIPLKPGIYELHLHFAETFYGPESAAGGGEGSRLITVLANGAPILQDFDALADSGGDRTAEVKVFTGISPATDGQLHLAFTSAKGGSAMVSAIEILPGIRNHLRPVRIVARDVPYYSNDSRWWSPDSYFKGGQLSSSQVAPSGTDDPEFYETERWGHFSYAIPVAPGRYTVSLYFMEHHGAGSRDQAPPETNGAEARVFNVFCNGKTVLANLNIEDQAGENRPLVRKIKGLEPNSQGKLLLEFVPVKRYATVTAIEVVPD